MKHLCSVILWSIATACSPALAQCYEWINDPDLSATESDSLTEAIAWDPDGAGPEPELLVVCGDIRLPGTNQHVNIAAWDGVTYRQLGSGLNQPPKSLAVLEGRLIAAGEFTASGATPLSALASFGPDGWQQYGPPVQGGTISSISAAPQRNLLVVGTFTSAGVPIPSGIALLKDGVWEPLPMAGNQVQAGQQAIAREGNDPYIYVGPYGFTGHLYKMDLATRVQWDRLVTAYPYPTHVRMKPDGTVGSLTWWNLGHTYYSWTQTFDGTQWTSNAGSLLGSYPTMDWAQRGSLIGSTLYTHFDPPLLAIQTAANRTVTTPVWSDAARVLLWRDAITAVGHFRQTPAGVLGSIATAQSDGTWSGRPGGVDVWGITANDDTVIGVTALSQPGGGSGNHALVRYQNGVWTPVQSDLTFMLFMETAGDRHYLSGYFSTSSTSGGWGVTVTEPDGTFTRVLTGEYSLMKVGDEVIASELAYPPTPVSRSYLVRGRTVTPLNTGFTGVIRSAARWRGADYVTGDGLTVAGVATTFARRTAGVWESVAWPMPGMPVGLAAGSQELMVRTQNPSALYAFDGAQYRQITPPGLAGVSTVTMGYAMEQLFLVGTTSTTTTGLLELAGDAWRAVPGGEDVRDFTSAGNSLVVMRTSQPLDNGLRRLRRLVTNCPADFNCDGGIEGADLEAFFTKWSSGSILADINQDGGVDFGDVGAFIEVWEAGGC